MTATSASAATFELSDTYRKVVIPFKLATSYRYDAVVAANGSLLTFAAGACATKPAPARRSTASSKNWWRERRSSRSFEPGRAAIVTQERRKRRAAWSAVLDATPKVPRC